MANFSDFIKNEKAFEQSKSQENIKSNVENNSQVDKDKLEKMIEDYSSLSENELMKEFLKLTMEKKRNGSLTDKELDSIKSTILPFLDSNQKNNLEKILEMVKNV